MRKKSFGNDGILVGIGTRKNLHMAMEIDVWWRRMENPLEMVRVIASW